MCVWLDFEIPLFGIQNRGLKMTFENLKNFNSSVQLLNPILSSRLQTFQNN